MHTTPTTSKVRHITGTKKREFFLIPTEHVAPRGGWSGGSRSYFDGLNYRTGAKHTFKQGDHFSVQTVPQVIPADTIMIETGVFCGKPAHAKIYCREDELQSVKTFLGLN